MSMATERRCSIFALLATLTKKQMAWQVDKDRNTGVFVLDR
jgi:hypothetical protein